MAAREPASLRRRDVSWDYDLALVSSAWGDDWKGFLAVHEDAMGTVDGYARYGSGRGSLGAGASRRTCFGSTS